MSCLSEIGLSRNQRVFVTLESTCGTLQFPNATTDFVRPAGNAKINQNPTFVDSEELQNTLDVLDQFQNPMPAGDWEVPMYIRIASGATPYASPQGSPFFESLQGAKVTDTRATLSATYTPSDIRIEYMIDSGDINFPERGVIELNEEAVGTTEVYYGSHSHVANAVTGSFGSLSTAYRGTTDAAMGCQATINLVSVFYDQDTSSSAFSLWVETDHFVQGLSGCTVNSAVLGVNNEGAVTINCSGQGMEMVWAGETTITKAAAAYAAGVTRIQVANGHLFSPGARVWNETKGDALTAATPGYIVSAVYATALALTDGIVAGATWASHNVIRGYLPTGTTIGTPIESRYSDLYIDSVLTKFKGGDLTFSTPKEYLTDEVGTDFAQDFLENTRSITSTLNLYFKKTDAEYFKDGYDGNNKAILIRFGSEEGARMEVWMKRCRLEVPVVNFAAPAVELNIPLKALGTDGEDSCEINFV